MGAWSGALASSRSLARGARFLWPHVLVPRTCDRASLSERQTQFCDLAWLSSAYVETERRPVFRDFLRLFIPRCCRSRAGRPAFTCRRYTKKLNHRAVLLPKIPLIFPRTIRLATQIDPDQPQQIDANLLHFGSALERCSPRSYIPLLFRAAHIGSRAVYLSVRVMAVVKVLIKRPFMT